MNHKRIAFFLFGLLSLFAGARTMPAAGQENPITFGAAQIDNQFPDYLTFSIPVSGAAGEIVDAKLFIRSPQQFSSSSQLELDVPVEAAAELNLEYQWTVGLPPSAPIIYYWEATDDAGNVARTQEIAVRYDDTRFDWQILENKDVAVWWHDRSNGFGDDVFDIANRAIDDQRALFDAELSYQIRIIIYNNFDEFSAWQPTAAEWVGGQAFPNYGITVQIVSAFGSQTNWLNEVVPHEISHLYFDQVSYNIAAPTPNWLNEGVAMYNEFSAQRTELRLVEQAAQDGELLSLGQLADGFGKYDDERVRLSYAESVSAVTFLVEEHGEKELAALLRAYQSGLLTEEAFQTALGISFGEFEQQWAAWAGAPQFATPTPWPFPTFPPSPTPNLVVTVPAAGATSTIAADFLPESTVTPEPILQPTATPQIQVVEVEPTEAAGEIVARKRGTNWADLLPAWLLAALFCSLCGGLLLFIGLGWLFFRRSARTTEENS